METTLKKKRTVGDWLMIVYAVGYWALITGSGIYYWPIASSFGDWWRYVLWQAVYALAWPIILVIQILGLL